MQRNAACNCWNALRSSTYHRVSVRSSRQRNLTTVAERAPISTAKPNRRALIAATLLAAGTLAYFIPPRRIRLDAPQAAKIGELGHVPERKDLIPFSEVNKHNKEDDLWVVINGKVYDLTAFLQDHPGGPGPLVKAAGKDASLLFNPFHPPGTIEDSETLPTTALKGFVDPNTLPKVPQGQSPAPPGDKAKKEIPLAAIVGIPDLEAAAEAVLSTKSFAYYSAGATNMHTLALNTSAWDQVLFKPRVLVDVAEVDTRTKFLGYDTTLPIFIAPSGMAKLSHPRGETAMAEAAGHEGIIQFVSTNASAKLEDIIGAATSKEQPFMMQLYVNKARKATEDLIQKVHDLKQLKAFFVTVDAAAPGKREADERTRAEVEVASGISGGKIQSDSKGGGIGRSVGGFIDPRLSWSDIKWLRSKTHLPIGLKGIQTVEDVVKAVEAGVDAVYLSNHGGRALDGSPPALYTLVELNKYYPEIVRDKKVEIYIDGGVRRGTDVVKALCLGATGVGMGRPFMYGLVYGVEGVEKTIDIMRDEIETTLRLLGVNSLKELGPHLINTKPIEPFLSEPAWGPQEKKNPL